ncbi:hypothetical protein CC2G_001380 [Coprinopsis cinerea AmutBmut pab1-1]|nr:hypothetical protein CC2G_001380 [Coprinopsis cinerea AmutBmut pab1-1]
MQISPSSSSKPYPVGERSCDFSASLLGPTLPVGGGTDFHWRQLRRYRDLSCRAHHAHVISEHGLNRTITQELLPNINGGLNLKMTLSPQIGVFY